jgi:hypothetical protein
VPQRLRENWAFLVTAAALLALLPLFLTFYVVDDAYISFRYARNLAEGHGFVFNPGSPVEGVTNLLWTLLLAAAFETGAIARWGIERFAIAAGLALGLAALWRTDCMLRALRVDWPLRLGALLVLAATTELWLSLTNGLEGALFAFLIVETLFQTAIRERFAAGALAGLLCFATRPEGLLVFPAAALAALVFGRAPDGERAWRARLGGTQWLAVGAFALAVLALSLLRIAYFDSVIPNSALAKRPDDLEALLGNLVLGRQYLASAATTNLLLAGSFVAAPLLFLLEPTRERRRAWALAGAVLLIGYGQSAAILVYGGDWMSFARLLSPYFFPFAVLGALLLGAGRWREGRAARTLVALCIAGTSVVYSNAVLARPSWLPAPRSWGIAYQDGGEYRKAVPALAACLTREDVFAAEKIGQIGYRLPAISIHDILGLTEAHVARHATRYYPRFGKTELAYTLTQVRPTLLLMNSGFIYLNTLDADAKRDFDARYELLRGPAESLDVIAVNREQRARMAPCLEGFRKVPEGLTGGAS